jgi:hypothetical protein
MSPPPKHLSQIKPGYLSDRYWRLPAYTLTNQVSEIRHHLKTHNYPHTVPSSEFPSLLNSLARSLPGYEKCKTAELRLFAHQRRLNNTMDIDIPTANRQDLASALRLADQSPEFHLFLKLPSELRELIYRFYCASFSSEPLTLPTYPPLARTNKQLLKEVLPIFYNECTFAVNLTTDDHSHDHSGSAIPHVLRMQRETTLFFKSLTPSYLSQIQNLEVTFDVKHPGVSVETFKLRVEVPRRGRKGTAKVIVDKFWRDRGDYGILHPWVGGRKVGKEELKVLEGRVEGFVEGIWKRGDGESGDGENGDEENGERENGERKQGEGESCLMIGDVYRLRVMLEEFFEEQCGS